MENCDYQQYQCYCVSSWERMKGVFAGKAGIFYRSADAVATADKLFCIANIPSLVALRSWFDTVSQSRGSLLNRILKIVFKHCLMTCCPPCRSCYGAIPTEALRCGAKSSSCPLAPPGKHDEQWLFACCWRKYPDSHSEIIESTFCTDGSKSVNSRCVSATAHQEESRRIFGDSNLK